MQKLQLNLRPDRVVFPDDVKQCPDCGYWDISDEEVQRVMKEAGRKLEEAQCKCNLDDYGKQQEFIARRVMTNLPFKGDDHIKTMQKFDTSDPERKRGTDSAVSAVCEFVKYAEFTPTMLLLVGSQGCGKSHLVEAVGWKAFNSGKSVRYELSPDMIDILRFGNSSEETFDWLDFYKNVGVFLLDDLGSERTNDFAIESLYSILDYRYRNHRPTVVTTNLLSQELLAAKVGARIADRVWDHNTDTCAQAIMTCTSYRTE